MSGDAAVSDSVNAKTPETLNDVIELLGKNILQIQEPELKSIKVAAHDRRVDYFKQVYGPNLNYTQHN